MALGGGVSFLVLLMMSAACSKVGAGDSDNSGTLAAALIESATHDSTSTPEKALVLRARALDRADSLDQAKRQTVFLRSLIGSISARPALRVTNPSGTGFCRK